MTAKQRNSIILIWGFAITTWVAAAETQSWKPDKPVEIIIAVGAGGAQDRAGRIIQKILQHEKLVPTPVTIVNKPGGGGAVAMAHLNQYQGDGRNLMIHAIGLVTNYITGKSALSYTDFTPIAILNVEYVGISVRTDSPIKNGKDLVERLRKDPGSLSVTIGTGLGGSNHISFILAMKAAGVDIKKLKVVVVRSGAEAMTAVLGAHVDAAAAPPSNQFDFIKAGKLRMLAIDARHRLAGDLANVPTWKELGVESSIFELPRGLTGPKGMSRAQIAFWDDTLRKVVRTRVWEEFLENESIENDYLNSSESASFWKAKYGDAKAALTELGLAK